MKQDTIEDALDQASEEANERNRTASALNNYLKNSGDLFSEQGIKLQFGALKWVESTAVRAMMMAGKTEFQNQVGDREVINDAFDQAINLLRLTHHQQAILTMLMNGEVVFKEGDAINSVKALACENQVEIIDKENSLCKLMSITIRTSTPKEHLNG